MNRFPFKSPPIQTYICSSVRLYVHSFTSLNGIRLKWFSLSGQFGCRGRTMCVRCLFFYSAALFASRRVEKTINWRFSIFHPNDSCGSWNIDHCANQPNEKKATNQPDCKPNVSEFEPEMRQRTSERARERVRKWGQNGKLNIRIWFIKNFQKIWHIICIQRVWCVCDLGHNSYSTAPTVIGYKLILSSRPIYSFYGDSIFFSLSLILNSITAFASSSYFASGSIFHCAHRHRALYAVDLRFSCNLIR